MCTISHIRAIGCVLRDRTAKSLVIHHIMSAVVSKRPWLPLVWFLKIVFHSKYLKLQEEQNHNDWFMNFFFFFFLWLGNNFFFFFKHILFAAVHAKTADTFITLGIDGT